MLAVRVLVRWRCPSSGMPPLTPNGPEKLPRFIRLGNAAEVGELPSCCALFAINFIFALRFWNQICTLRSFIPRRILRASRSFWLGPGVLSNVASSTTSCSGVARVRLRLPDGVVPANGSLLPASIESLRECCLSASILDNFAMHASFSVTGNVAFFAVESLTPSRFPYLDGKEMLWS